jgi:hypothetical protein
VHQSTAANAENSETLVTSWAVVNTISNTMHSVDVRCGVYARCSWSFQGRAQTVSEASLRGRGHWTCGVCYGSRELFE